MSIIQLLKKDHKELEGIMDRLEKDAIFDHKSVDSLFDKFKDLFYLHDSAEEKVFYPAIKRIKELSHLVLKGYQAHHSVNLGILELKLLPFSSENWAPKFSVIRDSILTHAQEEEELLFPAVEKHFDTNELNELADLVNQQRA